MSAHPRGNRASKLLPYLAAALTAFACSSRTTHDQGSSLSPVSRAGGARSAYVSLESDSESKALALENTLVARHLVYGQVMDPMDPAGGSSDGVPDDDLDTLVYVDNADSAIWTGHYLATAAFHQAVLPSSTQLQNVRNALAAIETLVDLTPTQDLLTRAAVPVNDPRVQGQCLNATASDSASCVAAKGTWNPVGPLMNYNDATTYGVYRGTVDGQDYYYFGQATRDQYAGVFLGLSVAYDLVADTGVQATCVDLATRLALGLNNRGWAWKMEGSPTVVVAAQSPSLITFETNPLHIAGILQVAKHLNPSVFTSLFADHQPGFLSSLELDYETLDIYTGYFKFNLDFIHFYNLIRLETDATNRRNYWNSYGTLRSATVGANSGFGNNPLFNMYDLVINGGAPWGVCATETTCPDANRESASANMLNQWWQHPIRDVYVDNSNNAQVPLCSPALSLLSSILSDIGLGSLFSAGGKVACDSIAVSSRVTDEFLWQVSPFQIAGGGAGNVEYSGLDYLLPYWMGRYYQVFTGTSPVQISSAGTGCANNFCLWIDGSGFTGDVTLTVEDPSGNVLNQYSASQLSISLSGSPETVTVPLATYAEQSMLANQGLQLVLNNPDNGSQATTTVTFPKLQGLTASVISQSPLAVTLTGFNIQAGALIALANNQQAFLSNAYGATQLTFNAGDATQPATVSFDVSGEAVSAVQSGAGMVAILPPDSATWQFVPISGAPAAQ